MSEGMTDESILRKTANTFYCFVVSLYFLGYILSILNLGVSHPGIAELGVKIQSTARILLMILLLEQFNRSITRGIVSMLVLAAVLVWYFVNGYFGLTDLLLMIPPIIGCKNTTVETVRTERQWRILLTIITGVAFFTGILFIQGKETDELHYEKNTYQYNSVSNIVNKETAVSQSFHAKMLKAIRVYTVTYGKQPEGLYQVSLFDDDGHLLESREISGSSIHDWGTLEILLENTYSEGKYLLRMECPDPKSDSVALLQNDSNPYPDGESYINHEPTENDWIFEYAFPVEDNTWLCRGILIVLWMMILGLIWIKTRPVYEKRK